MQTNGTIYGKFLLENTNDYQQGVSEVTQTMIANTNAAIFDPYDTYMYNRFNDLLNMISMSVLKAQLYENPIRKMFQKEPLYYGNTIRNVAIKWIEAHSFDDTAVDLLKNERPEFVEWYYTRNRADKYPWTYNATELRMAMNGDPSSFGLNELILGMAAAAKNKDNYDEREIELALIAQADANWKDGLFKVQVDAVSDQSTGEAFLAKVREKVNEIECNPSCLYNSIPVPTFANRDEMVLLTTPKTDAYVDVYTLANTFHIDKADVSTRKVMLPHLGIPEAVAILTTKDFIEPRDTFYGIRTFDDPNTLNFHNYLHHQGVYAINPAVPTVVFTTGNGTSTSVVSLTTTGFTAVAESATIEAGGTDQITCTLSGTVSPTGTDIVVAPNTATYTVSISRTGDSGTESIAVNSKTYVDEYGILHLQKSGVEAGDVVTVSCAATYTDGTGTTTYVASVEVTVE